MLIIMLLGTPSALVYARGGLRRLRIPGLASIGRSRCSGCSGLILGNHSVEGLSPVSAGPCIILPAEIPLKEPYCNYGESSESREFHRRPDRASNTHCCFDGLASASQSHGKEWIRTHSIVNREPLNLKLRSFASPKSDFDGSGFVLSHQSHQKCPKP